MTQFSDMIIIGGHAYRWRALCEERRDELAAWRAAKPVQPLLFSMKEDARPAAERTADSRYLEPTFLSLMHGSERH
jgi:hypothetical protein